jgi:hypothetical protein
MTGKGFRLDAAHIVNTADVGFVEWREYSVALPTLPNGLPNFAAAVPVGVSDWTNLVGKKVIFNSIEPQGGRLVRCIYEYMPRTNEVSYREYDVPLNAAGQEDDLTDAEPTTAKRIDAIILKDITVFQIGRSSQGLRDWEAYPTIGESQLMTNPITNAYIRVFVRTRNEDLRYRTNKSFLSRSNRREYNFWTPNNKNTSYEFDPTLVAYL